MTNREFNTVLIDLLTTLSNDYTTRNEYGRSYDNYYIQYDMQGSEISEHDIPMIAQSLLDEMTADKIRDRRIESIVE